MADSCLVAGLVVGPTTLVADTLHRFGSARAPSKLNLDGGLSLVFGLIEAQDGSPGPSAALAAGVSNALASASVISLNQTVSAVRLWSCHPAFAAEPSAYTQ